MASLGQKKGLIILDLGQNKRLIGLSNSIVVACVELTNVIVFPSKFKNTQFHPCEFASGPRATWHTVGECSLNVLGQLANNPIPIHIRFPYEKINKNCYDFTSVWITKWWSINMDRPQKHNLRWKRHNVRWKSVRRICIQNKNIYWKFLLFMNTKLW